MVLGAAGFIGRWVVRALHRQNAIIHAVVRNPARVDDLRGIGAATVAVADLATEGSIGSVLDHAQPAVVFNLAGYGVDPGERDHQMMEAVNSRLVEELRLALEAQPAGAWDGLRLVHTGSALEYGSVPGALTEDLTPHPTTDYGRTKLAGTQHVVHSAARSGLRSAVARLFTVYGPGEHAGRLLPSLLAAARSHTRVSLTAGTQPRDFTYVEDAAEGLLRLGASQAPPGTVVNLATGHLTSVRVFAETAAALLGMSPDSLEFGALPVRTGEMFHGDVDVRRLERLLSWKPRTTVAEGIQRTLEYERPH